MGTTTLYRRIDADTALRIKEDNQIVYDIVFPKLPPPEEKPRSFLSRLFKSKPPPGPPQPTVDWEQVYHQPYTFDLDKAAEGLHFLLTGGGRPYESAELWWVCPTDPHFLGDESDEAAEQPMWLIEPDEVAKFHTALEALTREIMAKRFDPAAMMEMPIYPDIWDRAPAEDDTLGWLVEKRDALLKFLAETKVSGKALVGCLIY